MSDVQSKELAERYSLFVFGQQAKGTLAPRQDGNWVRYADHLAALASSEAKLAEERAVNEVYRDHLDLCASLALGDVADRDDYEKLPAKINAVIRSLRSNVIELNTRLVLTERASMKAVNAARTLRAEVADLIETGKRVEENNAKIIAGYKEGREKELIALAEFYGKGYAVHPHGYQLSSEDAVAAFFAQQEKKG